ncbi:cholinesterase [Aspergillus terreus NIH2624]|uniref:Carboxylic ester hydrolase n=1 Tax=Aspergillus terreus (strain NIH 2624 / FGSC A1156) TaxID=341663 RepID=Q0CJM6_ASPTN|nr:cholinesterase [Aspergillus terreus NIH2624]EAU33869.1 cholinesterase [Aspergillus terreus NIH2624]
MYRIIAFYSIVYLGFLSWSTADAFLVGGPVNTTSGTVRGKASSLRPDVSEYLGIPYAKAPKGDLRFAAPVPADKSPTVLNATSYVCSSSLFSTPRFHLVPNSLASDCPCNRIPMRQAALGGPVGEKITRALSQEDSILDEDCLTINVWSKPQQGEQKKAVLFWIYGGGFAIGSASSAVYDGSILADENDVVVVSFNYRLNIFGFSGAPGQPWNVGLLDQRLALEWTRDNIARFGGDPARITVFGQSAGGLSTDFMAYSYPDDPIAHALIAHSGVASSSLSIAPKKSDLQETWYNVSSSLGCGGAEAGEQTVACMRSKSQDELLAAIEPLTTGGMVGGFTPVGDGQVIPEDIAGAGDAGNFARIPFMTGNTDNEAGFFLITALAYTNLTAEQVAAIPMNLIRPLGNILTLAGFTCPAAEAAGYRLEHRVPAWRYRYYGGNYSNTYIVPVGSAYHTSELLPLFGTAPTVTGVKDTWYEAEAAAYMRNAWATFAKNPATGLSSEFRWPKFNPLSRWIFYG